ncbi:MAG: pyrroline-5-carboxylate reductase family protein, partial [Acidimicrobiales bacterium]
MSAPRPAAEPQLVVFGGGRMGEALVSGLLRAGETRPDRVVIIETHEGRRAELTDGLAARFAGLAVTADLAAVDPGAGILLAVKPQDAPTVCERAATLYPRRLLSIAAGVTVGQLEGWLGEHGGGGIAVLRAMPNTPALVGAGASAVAAGTRAGDQDLAWAHRLLGAVGTVATGPE